jgi:hypothetical protein
MLGCRQYVHRRRERAGEAIDVVAMAAEGGRLAATGDGRLWEREATLQNITGR